MSAIPFRGEIWWCDLSVGPRPVVVLSRNQTILATRRALVAPCTRTVRGLETEVVLGPADDPVLVTTAVNLDSVQNVAFDSFVRRLGVIAVDRMHEICQALAVAVDC